MARQTRPLVVETETDRHRPHHLRVTLSGDLEDTPQVTAQLDQLAKTILALGGKHGSLAAMLVIATELEPRPSGCMRWIMFALAQPAEVAFIYSPSLLADRVCDYDEYIQRCPHHVFVDSWSDK